ncbi:MAG: MFS transporter [Alphaproteobacteria bacterium]|nr:MFS transporter [Alphaproteobacteria bacterium]
MEHKNSSFSSTFYGIAFSGLFLNASTAGLFSILPLYTRDVIGLSEMLVAQVDSIAEMCAYGSRIFVGSVVDAARSRKPILFWSMLLLGLSQMGFIWVWSAASILILRCAQRTFSGFVAVPRDVMVGATLPPNLRARGYSLQRVFKTTGSVVGAIMALPFLTKLSTSHAEMTRCAAVCAAFAFVAVAFVWFLVKEPRHTQARVRTGKLLIVSLVKCLPAIYWRILGVAGFYHLGHFSETFLIFRLTDHNVVSSFIPFAQVAWSMGAITIIYPIGILGDRIGIKRALLNVFALMVAGNLCLAVDHVWVNFLGMLLWGAQTYSTQTLLAAEINRVVPENLRGTAFGVLYLVCGLSLVGASSWAGLVWAKLGHSAMFYGGGIVGVISIVLAIFMFPDNRKK